MRVSLLYNTKSGRGLAGPLAGELFKTLKARKHDVAQFDVSQSTDAGPRAIEHGEVVCVVGGDGSVHHTLPLLADSECALYHVPLGTENLFSRDWKMSREPEQVARAIDRGETTRIDLGMAGDRPFALMVSLGPDANVIHRIHAERTGPITHLSYVKPAIQEFLAPSLAPLSIKVDGQAVVQDAKGFCVIANSSQYGGRIDPAAKASLTDGKLDVFFAPASTGIDIAACLVRSRMRDEIEFRDVVYRQGAAVELSAGSLPSQIDGEKFLAETGELKFTVRSQALKVLLA